MSHWIYSKEVSFICNEPFPIHCFKLS